MSALAERPAGSAPATAPAAPRPVDAGRAAWLRRLPPEGLMALGLGVLLAAVSLGAGGGLQVGRTTSVEMALQAAGGALGALALLTTPRARLHGALALAGFVAFAAFTALSVVWAVQPGDAWLEASRTLAYLAAFVVGLALVRLAPGRWGAMVNATVVAAGLVSAYALATKVIPGTLNPDETFARLREPFGYWNAVGLTAALGAPGCLWLGARRHGHAAVNALAFPVLALLLVALLLAYSRGALLALAAGCGVWFAVVPLRLRGAAVLGAATAGAGLVVAWVFSQDALSKDAVPLALRETAGVEFGLLLGVMVVVLSAVGLAIGFRGALTAPGLQTRRRAGAVLLAALALVPVGGLTGLALSEKGLGGSISDGFAQLFDPDVSAKSSPSNDASRLTAVGSVRARYYADSLQVFADRPVLGSGAGGFATARPRIRPDELDVRHSHGFLFQTLSDFGTVGVVIVLALLAAWLAAALRATALLPRRGAPRPFVDAELVGLRTLLAIVVVYGVHSFVDWTWFIPGTTVLAVLCAGWLAGRGPARTRAGSPLAPVGPSRTVRAAVRDRPRAAIAAGVLVLAVAAAWATYQPLRSQDRGNEALAALEAGKVDEARSLAREAADIDPLSVDPLYNLSVIEATAGRRDAARGALERAVQLQPQNAIPWLRLAEYDAAIGDAKGALAALGPALYLDPRNTTAVTLFLDATRRLAGTPPPTTP